MRHDASPSGVYYDRIQERYLVELTDGSMMDWDHGDWIAVMWVVDGRTDTDWENLRGPGRPVFFFKEIDAKAAIAAIRLHEEFLSKLVDLEQKLATGKFTDV